MKCCLSIIVALTILLSVPACRREKEKKRNDEDLPYPKFPAAKPCSKPAGLAFEALVRSYRSASSEGERWKLAKERLILRDADEALHPELSAKRQILVLDALSYAWLLAYPDIVCRLPLESAYLEELAKWSESQDFICLELGPGRPGHPTVTKYSDTTCGETARLWLERLTGVYFVDRAAFEAWLAPRRDRLVWNQAAGRFEVRE